MAIFMVLPWSVCVCVTIVSVKLVTTEMISPRGRAVLIPLCLASHKRHRALRSHGYFQALWSCQSRFWSVTKQREMFTTSRAISKHTSSLTSSISSSISPCRLTSWATCRGRFSHLMSPFAPACAVDCLLGSRFALCPGPSKAQGKPGQ